jgi:hypothetical protein
MEKYKQRDIHQQDAALILARSEAQRKTGNTSHYTDWELNLFWFADVLLLANLCQQRNLPLLKTVGNMVVCYDAFPFCKMLFPYSVMLFL